MSLSDRLKPWEVVADRLRHLSRADVAVAIYNPRSVARPGQLHAAKAVLLEVRSPETVVVLARDVGRAEESCTVTTLEAFDPGQVDMKTLVIIGSSPDPGDAFRAGVDSPFHSGSVRTKRGFVTRNPVGIRDGRATVSQAR